MILTVNMLIYLEVLTYWNLVKYSSVPIINLDQLSQNEMNLILCSSFFRT